MPRAIRAFAVLMTLGGFACSFSRSGVAPGEPVADGAPADPDAGADSDTVDSDQPDAFDEPAFEAGSDDTDAGDAVSPDDARTDADAAADAGIALDGSPDAAEVDGEADAMPAVDASDASTIDDASPDATSPCAPFPRAKAFAPPGGPPHCYWPHDNASNWLTAANTCVAEGGHLVTLTTDAETNFLIGWLPAIADGDRIWIGGTDGRFSGDGPGSGPYVWITGEPFVYTNWFTSPTVHEPDGLCDACMGNPCYCEHRVALVGDGRWVDAYEAVLYRFVCEADR